MKIVITVKLYSVGVGVCMHVCMYAYVDAGEPMVQYPQLLQWKTTWAQNDSIVQ